MLHKELPFSILKSFFDELVLKTWDSQLCDNSSQLEYVYNHSR
jgi:hypothetical protein